MSDCKIVSMRKREIDKLKAQKEQRAQAILESMDELQTVVAKAGKPRLLVDFLFNLETYGLVFWKMSEAEGRVKGNGRESI